MACENLQDSVAICIRSQYYSGYIKPFVRSPAHLERLPTTWPRNGAHSCPSYRMQA
ncbi:hypothetical protein LIA77_11358 [Sarocladium implicatum]|nr:hypothetical protein LIA77_11358 [Sarocladium implicatum]